MPVPGPAPLGRGVVMSAGAAPPAPWRDAPVVTIDDAVLADPAADGPPAARAVGPPRAGRHRPRHVDPAAFREPQSFPVEPWRVAPDAEPWFDRLHFLTWANTYDARAGEPVWWWGVKAARLDDGAAATPDGPADITLADGTPAWVDGGPAHAGAARPARSCTATPSTSVRWPSCRPTVAPRADLAPDQLAAVAHVGGPARVIAPAGSGKTRVLTERLRHLHRDRGYEPAHGARRRLQQAGPARDGGPHHRLPAPGAHAQLARPVGARRAPRRLAAGARRARRPSPRRLAAARQAPAAGQHRSRSGRTSRA